MENYEKVKKTIRYIIIGIILIIIIIIAILFYNNWQAQENNNRLYNYLEANNYQQNADGIYYKTNNLNNTTTTDKAITQEYLFARNISKENDNYTSISLQFTKDKTINIIYQEEGFDQKNNYGILFQEGTYKDGKFECKIVTNKNFNTKCDLMKEQAQEYDKEIKQILKSNKIDPKHIKIKSKETSKV